MARDNGQGFKDLDAMIQKIKAVGLIPKEVAPQVADALRAEITKNIAAGVDPGGKPWKLTEKGEKPLKNAAASLDVKAVGTVVLAKLTGPVALHHLGAARGHIRRQVLPSSRLPQPMTQAIKAVLTKAFKAKTGAK
jgi:hypothetical protein